MHISEGMLSGSVLFAGVIITASGTAIGLKKLSYDKIPQAGILSASFFVSSLIHVPLTLVSVHLILNGLIGLMLGWGAFPVILSALTLQAIFFQIGGVTTLGINTAIMALPAVMCYHFLGRFISKDRKSVMCVSFLCGFFSVFFAAVFMSLALFLSGKAFFEIASAAFLTHLLIMIIEGIVTAFCVSFLIKVQPTMLSQISGVK